MSCWFAAAIEAPAVSFISTGAAGSNVPLRFTATLVFAELDAIKVHRSAVAREVIRHQSGFQTPQ
jgi:hypothetical protein